MGISMRVYECADTEIRAMQSDRNRLNQFIRKAPMPGECYLADFWDALHYVLMRDPEARGLPFAAVKFGDVAFADGETHAIFNRTVRELDRELRRLREALLRERFDFDKMLVAKVYPMREWASPENKESAFQDLLTYFRRLSRTAAAAASSRQGLVFVQYEDW